MDRIPLRNDYHRLPAEFKETWINALRSGGFSQTQQSLRDNLGMCCLGVLCEVNNVGWRYDEITDEWMTVNDSAGVPSVLDLGEDIIEILMQDVMPTDEERKDGSIMCELTWMNDRDGKTFGEIADWIEENL